VTKIWKVVSGNWISTSSTTRSPIPGMKLDINTTGSPVLIIFSINIRNHCCVNRPGCTGAAIGHIELFIDGKLEDFRVIGNDLFSPDYIPVSLTYMADLSAGNHTIQMYWVISQASAGLCIEQAHGKRSLIVIEFKR